MKITGKNPGEPHDDEDLADITEEILSGAHWVSVGESHRISLTLDREAVYQIEMTPTDLAGNTSGLRSTVIFEIDTTAPLVQARNGVYIEVDDIEFLDTYPYSRKDDPAPTVEFYDLKKNQIFISGFSGCGLLLWL